MGNGEDNRPGSPGHMDRARFRDEMDQVKETALGLQMVNHVATCKECRAILEDANRKVVTHIQQTDI